MAIKTFNINEKVYKEFSKHCRSQGISMSKKIENFILFELEKIKKSSKTHSLKEEIKLENHSFSKYC